MQEVIRLDPRRASNIRPTVPYTGQLVVRKASDHAIVMRGAREVLIGRHVVAPPPPACRA